MLEEMMADDGRAIVQAVIEAAKSGDLQAARIVLDRILPLPKGRRVGVVLPEAKDAGDVLTAFSAVASALAEGDITIEEAQGLGSFLEARRKTIETIKIEARLSALETRGGAK